MRRVDIGAGPLTAADVAAIATGAAEPALADAARQRIADSHAELARHAGSATPIYGVTTGLGANADTAVDRDDTERARRVPFGRSVGVGRIADDAEVRAMMTARIAGFAVGCSGVSPAVADTLLALLRSGVIPVVPMTGSMGEGDLPPLSHIGSVLAGRGRARFTGETMPGPDALARADLAPPPFAVKDGLALVSSNAASTGLGALAVTEATAALGGMIAAAALSFEAFRGNVAPLLPQAVALRPAPGQAAVSAALLDLLAGGALMQPGAARRLQDPLSFRCVASIYGAATAALDAATTAVELELNTSDDNPAVVPGTGIVPNANFDPTHLALAFDTLAQALARATATIGMRTDKLLSPRFSDLPRFLSPLADGRAGFGPTQKAVAALTAEIQHAAIPMPAWVIPTADGVEDVATLALAAVGKTRDIVARVRTLAAIELLFAAQACELRDGLALGHGTAAILYAVRACVPALDEDRETAPDIAALDTLIAEGHFAEIAPTP